MNNESTKITSIVPTYKRNNYLERAIHGVLNQKHSNIILKIFDNDPQNNLPKELDTLINQNPFIHYTKNESNIGSLNNFKKCFESIDTPFFSVQSDDDLILPNFYADALEVFAEFPNIGFVVFESLIINKLGKLITPGLSTGDKTLYTTNKPIQLSNIPFTWTSMLFRREIAEIFAEAVIHPHDIGSDMRCLVRAMSRYDFVVVNKPAACFTANQESTSSVRASVEEGTAYHIVQLSRHVDVIKDNQVCEAQRIFHSDLLHSARKKNLYFTWIRIILIDIGREWIEIDEIDYSRRLEKNISALARFEKGKIAGKLLVYLRKNQFLRGFFRLLLRNYFLQRRQIWLREMSALEQGKYADIFSQLRAIE